MTKKLIAIVVAFIAAVPLMADTQSDWYASLSKKRTLTSVRVGEEYWRASDTDKPLPYRFSCGAVLHSTAGGKRLDLNNTIVEGGIYAYGDISIFLTGNSMSFGRVRSEGSMLIFGYGSLTISRIDGHGFFDMLMDGAVEASGALSVCMGASITVREPAGTGIRGGDSFRAAAP